MTMFKPPYTNFKLGGKIEKKTLSPGSAGDATTMAYRLVINATGTMHAECKAIAHGTKGEGDAEAVVGPAFVGCMRIPRRPKSTFYDIRFNYRVGWFAEVYATDKKAASFGTGFAKAKIHGSIFDDQLKELMTMYDVVVDDLKAPDKKTEKGLRDRTLGPFRLTLQAGRTYFWVFMLEAGARSHYRSFHPLMAGISQVSFNPSGNAWRGVTLKSVVTAPDLDACDAVTAALLDDA